MNRPLLAAAAALIIVVAGAALLLRPSATIGPPSSPTPAPTTKSTATSPAASSGLVPAELLHNWVGYPHAIAGRQTVRALQFGFESGQLHVTADYADNYFTSKAVVVARYTLELTALSNGCDLGVVGHYTWGLSVGGTLIHLSVADDPCEARANALVGDWHSADCKDPTDVCWGDLEAGSWPTLFYSPRLDFAAPPAPLYAGVNFTVPDGWAVGGDHTTDFRLLRSTDYASEGANGPVGAPTQIEAWIRPTNVLPDSDCAATAVSTTEGTPEGLITWLSNRMSGISTTAAQDIDIDGHPGRWIDVNLLPDWTRTCPGSDGPTVPLITQALGDGGSTGDDPYVVGIAGQARMRLIFVDISQPELHQSHTAMIVITAPSSAAFDAFIEQAMPIVKSFHFQ